MRIGVYLCRCGSTLSDSIDLPRLSASLSQLPDVAYVKIHHLFCSPEGRNFLTEEVAREKPDRIVIAACTPREHERTFRNVLRDAGFNPYLFQMANVREQVAWVTPDRDRAYEMALAYIRAAIRRVALHEPLEITEMTCNPDVLVIGAGVAGIEAALVLAESGRSVCLVERHPYIGGKAMQYEEVFPTRECSSCMLAPKLDDVIHQDRIELLTNSEVVEVAGYVGNFTVKIARKATYVDRDACVGCGECSRACPVLCDNPFDFGMSQRKAIDLPFSGAMPHAPTIERCACLRFRGADCTICKDVCRFDAIRYDDHDVIVEKTVGAIIVATGFDVLDASILPRFGYGRFPEVYTSLEFERVLSVNGPTGGKVLMKNGTPPSSIAFIHCVGSRDPAFKRYCSGVCCLSALKCAAMVEERIPSIRMYDLCSDWCVPGRNGQSLLTSLLDSPRFSVVRVSLPLRVRVKQKAEKLQLTCVDDAGKRRRIVVDMAVLYPPLIPSRGSDRIADMLMVSRGRDGFFSEACAVRDPVSTSVEGVFVAGCAEWPKDIQGSISQGAASAARVLASLVPGRKMELNPMTATLNREACSQCLMCKAVCPFGAVLRDSDTGEMTISPALCRGCGICVAACPAGALQAKHFSHEQLTAEIEEVLR